MNFLEACGIAFLVLIVIASIIAFLVFWESGLKGKYQRTTLGKKMLYLTYLRKKIIGKDMQYFENKMHLYPSFLLKKMLLRFGEKKKLEKERNI